MNDRGLPDTDRTAGAPGGAVSARSASVEASRPRVPRAYVGDTRSRKLLEQLRGLGYGQVVVRGRLHLRRLEPWFYDNGAFEDWRAGRAFNAEEFMREVGVMATMKCQPDFAVAPDVVGDAAATVSAWNHWRPRLPDSIRWYFAAQDGCSESMVPWGQIDGLFVGGTLDWKLRTGADWVRWSHERMLPCHIGRVGTRRRVSWSIDCGADSIDSSLPLWSRAKFDSFVGALKQIHLFGEP